MSSLRSIVLGCVSDRGPEQSQPRSGKRPVKAPYERPRSSRVKFGVSLADALRDDTVPEPLVEILVYLAREGVTTSDLFRRPGNSADLKMIMKRLSEGREIQLSNYNFYTLASVVKKFLLKIPGGIFGPEVESQLLHVLEIDNRIQQHDVIHGIISSLSPAVQKLVALLFGTWFRIVSHSEYNTMSSESVAKSVAGSLFHTCADDPIKVDRAVHVLQILIDDFGVGKMFGQKNIQYFAEMTRTGMNIREKFCYELSLPAEKSLSELKDYLHLFWRLVDCDVLCHSRDPASIRAITEDEFCSLQHPATSSKASPESSTAVEGTRQASAASTPSPLSLQPIIIDTEMDPEHNPHKKLTHVSSLSAPEVNQGCMTPSNVMSPSSPCPGLSTSLSRFDSVKRRQLVRLRKRSLWFLSPNFSDDSQSALNSFEASGGGISSMDRASEAATSDGTVSDCVAPSDGIRISSDFDCPFDEGVTSFRSTDPVLRRLQVKPRHEIEEQVTTSQTLSQLPPPSSQGILTSSAERSDADRVMVSIQRLSLEDKELKEGRTRYFMVENYYGSAEVNRMQS